jgi:hypothetical protein
MRYGNLKLLVTVILTLSTTLIANTSFAQARYNFGITPTAEDLSAWGPLVGPSGQELPPGSGTAEKGAPIYAQKCAFCHGPTGAEPFMASTKPKPWTPENYCCFPAPLVGGDDSLTGMIPVKTVGIYWASATTLWDYINRGMPPDIYFKSTQGYEFAEAINEMGELTADEVYSLTAFILSQSNIVKKTEVMNAETLPKVKMPGLDVVIPKDPGEWYPKRQLDPHISPKSRSLN